MHSRTLGRTDVRLSEIALGTWGLATDAYGPRGPTQMDTVIKRALDEGVTTFDVAPAWGDGEAERGIAKATKEKRDEVQYVTRCGAVWTDDGLVQRFEPEALEKDCEESLKRLETDRIDVLLLHCPSEEELRKEEWKKTMEKLKKDGKTRAWGVSAGDADAARIAIAAGAEAICIVYNLILSDDLHDLSGEISVGGCGVLARSPLSYGLLSGRWSEMRRFGDGDHRQDRWTPEALRARVQQVQALRYLVHGKVPSLASAAIRYVLANAVVTSCVVGSRTSAQIALSAQCSDEPPYLPDEDITKLPKILAKVGA
jgi:aryl-alcohol dehydrogenase-like predicted oxidoreductase